MFARFLAFTFSIMLSAFACEGQTVNNSISSGQLALARIKSRVINDDVNHFPQFQPFNQNINYWLTAPTQLNADGSGYFTVNITLPSTSGIILYVGSDMAMNPNAPRTIPDEGKLPDNGQFLDDDRRLFTSVKVTSGNVIIGETVDANAAAAYGLKLKDAPSTSAVVELQLHGNVPSSSFMDILHGKKASGAQTGVIAIYALQTIGSPQSLFWYYKDQYGGTTTYRLSGNIFGYKDSESSSYSDRPLSDYNTVIVGHAPFYELTLQSPLVPGHVPDFNLMFNSQQDQQSALAAIQAAEPGMTIQN